MLCFCHSAIPINPKPTGPTSQCSSTHTHIYIYISYGCNLRSYFGSTQFQQLAGLDGLDIQPPNGFASSSETHWRVGSQRTRQFSVAASARAFLLEMQQARVACNVLLAKKSGYKKGGVPHKKLGMCQKKTSTPKFGKRKWSPNGLSHSKSSVRDPKFGWW